MARRAPDDLQYACTFPLDEPIPCELQLVRALGTRASAGSVCPRFPTGIPGTGDYAPALNALLTRLEATLN